MIAKEPKLSIYPLPILLRVMEMAEVVIKIPDRFKVDMSDLARGVEEFVKLRLARDLMLARLDELLKHSKLTDEECIELGKMVKKGRFEISISEYRDFLSDAKTISPDPDDIDLFALTLKLDCPIWAQEKAFKKQSQVKVFSTSDLISFLSGTVP